ncbi:MAG: hypothetical protein ACLTSX_01155 [Collinsella sp.]
MRRTGMWAFRCWNATAHGSWIPCMAALGYEVFRFNAPDATQ